MDIAIVVIIIGLFLVLTALAVRKLRRRTDAYPDAPPRGRPGANDREPRRPLVPAGSSSAAAIPESEPGPVEGTFGALPNIEAPSRDEWERGGI